MKLFLYKYGIFSTMKYLKTAVIIVLVHFTCILAQCPPAELILPCDCDSGLLPIVSCTNIYDMVILEKVFDRSADRLFYLFVLSESTLMYLPAKAVSSKQFIELLISNSTMTALFDIQPGPENQLAAIVLNNVRFQRGVGWELFKNLKNLKVFTSKDTEIMSLGRSFVENINPDLTNLFLKNAKVKKLYPNAFQKLGQLSGLEITNSFITELKRSMFATPSDLETVDFSGNQIESLPADIFSEMPKLASITLNDNKISSVSETVFKNAYGNVHYISLESNPLKCDCSLKWFLNKDHQEIVGQCDYPNDKKGKQLADLTAADFDYCR